MTDSQQKRIGFIGLGVMGAGMARRVHAKFGPLTIFDLNEGVVRSLVEEGAVAVSSPAAVAEACDCIFLSLPAAPQVNEVLFGANGVASKCRSGLVIVDLSTIGPTPAQEFAARLSALDVTYLDVPVGGGQHEAASGKLTLMAGGPEASVEAVRDVLAEIGTELHYLGASGMGQAAKLALNLSYGVMLAGASEAVALMRSLGADLSAFSKMQAGLNAGAWFRRPALDAIAGSFEPGFRVDLMRKDLALAVDAGAAAHLPMPAAGRALDIFDVASDAGLGEKHTSVLSELYRPALLEQLRGFPDRREAGTRR